MRTFVLVSLTLLPSAALAHTGEGHVASLMTGLGHPLGGPDHVLAMVAVGLWAALAGGRALWAAPVTFVAAMLAGGGIGMAGVVLPGIEPAILASIIVLGVMVALALRLPLGAALPLIALFGVMHGAAHGLEGPAGGMVGYAAGFALATAGLHVAGLALGLGLVRGPGGRAVQALGGATALAGAALAMGA